MFRASHRAESSAEGTPREAAHIEGAPFHSFLKKDAQPLTHREAARVRFLLMPTAYRFAKVRPYSILNVRCTIYPVSCGMHCIMHKYAEKCIREQPPVAKHYQTRMGWANLYPLQHRLFDCEYNSLLYSCMLPLEDTYMLVRHSVDMDCESACKEPFWHVFSPPAYKWAHMKVMWLGAMNMQFISSSKDLF